MGRKSNMARAGKAAHNAWKEQRRQATARQAALEKAKTDRLLLSEFLPPVFAQGLGEDAGQDMTTIEEAATGAFTRSTYDFSKARLAYAIWPYRLGHENLEHFQRFWQTKLAETEAKARELERAKLSEEVFNTQITIERIKASINYLTALIDMERPGMPVLPLYRRKNYFRPSDWVWCYIPADDRFEELCQGSFIRGTVATVMESGAATVRLHTCVKANPTVADLEECYMTYAKESLLILRNDEYQHLLADSFLSDEWLHLAATTEDQKSLAKPIYEALRKEQLRLEVGDYKYVAAVRANSKKG